MAKEELEYLGYFTNQIEMDIKVVCDIFLYEIHTLNNHIKDKLNIYKKHDKIYAKINKSLSNIEMGTLLETSKIIYGKEAKQISKTMKEVVL